MISVWSCSQCPVYFCLWHMTWTIGQNSSKFSFREWGSYLGLRIVWELTAIIMAIAATSSVISHHQSVECQQPLLLWQLLQCHCKRITKVWKIKIKIGVYTCMVYQPMHKIIQNAIVDVASLYGGLIQSRFHTIKKVLSGKNFIFCNFLRYQIKMKQVA